MTWAARVPEVIRPKARQVGLALGEALDARGQELADAQAQRPEPWVLETLGAFPAEGSPAPHGFSLGRSMSSMAMSGTSGKFRIG